SSGALSSRRGAHADRHGRRTRRAPLTAALAARFATASPFAPGAGPGPAAHRAAQAAPVLPDRRSAAAGPVQTADHSDSSAARPSQGLAPGPGWADGADPAGAVPGRVPDDLRAPAARRPSPQDRVAGRPAVAAAPAPETVPVVAPASRTEYATGQVSATALAPGAAPVGATAPESEALPALATAPVRAAVSESATASAWPAADCARAAHHDRVARSGPRGFPLAERERSEAPRAAGA